MLKSKYFWIAMAILVPFIVVWVMEGFGWAIATLVIMGILFLFILGGTRSTRRRKRYYYYDDDDDYDEEIIEEIIETRRPRRPSSPLGGKGPVPINRKGVEFITGAKGSRKMQERELNQILRRLRR